MSKDDRNAYITSITMVIMALITIVVMSLCLPQLAIEYFAEGCMVWDSKGKIVKTGPDTWEFRPTYKCNKIFLD